VLFLNRQSHSYLKKERIGGTTYHILIPALCKPDSWAPYYRIIFELLDRLCQIIENPLYLLILQLPSFQSKITLWNDFWSSLNVILSKILKKGHFLKKMPKSKKPTTAVFYCCSFKSKKVILSKVQNAGPKIISKFDGQLILMGQFLTKSHSIKSQIMVK